MLNRAGFFRVHFTISQQRATRVVRSAACVSVISRTKFTDTNTASIGFSSTDTKQMHTYDFPRDIKTLPHFSPSFSFYRLRNDLYCVEWDVKLCYTIPYLSPFTRATQRVG